MIKTIQSCRICANAHLKPIIDLGAQALTGIFPHTVEQEVLSGPLELVQCTGSAESTCGLLQLRHNYAMGQLYGDHYGYRSALNHSMVMHLKDIVTRIEAHVTLGADDIVLDIGSNDGTLLKAYHNQRAHLVGIDPAANKFRKYYTPHIELINNFFSKDIWHKTQGTKRARIITSIAMFYDLESPLQFMQDVYDCLTDDGLWCFEQSYMPIMLKRTAYDTICHEHFEYYGLRQIKWMADRVGFKIIEVSLNETNGGSFCVMVVKKDNDRFKECTGIINTMLENESHLTEPVFLQFRDNVQVQRDCLRELIGSLNKSGKKVLGYGASTKGNVILQYAGFTPKDIPGIAEVNEDKFNCYTPGTRIPIMSERDAKALNPDFFLVLPWHFESNIIHREKDYLESGGQLIFPLPQPRIHSHLMKAELS